MQSVFVLLMCSIIGCGPNSAIFESEDLAVPKKQTSSEEAALATQSMQQRIGTLAESSLSSGPLQPYVPQKEDFVECYEADSPNAERQTFEQYFDWVQTFYRGNLLSKGWTAQSDAILSRISESPEQRSGIASQMNELGKLVASEWSKDNEVRKVSTSDLWDFGRRLEQAENLEELEAVIACIQNDIIRKFQISK